MSGSMYKREHNEWSRWEPGDTLGRANLLTDERVLQASRLILTGARFTLGLPICSPQGDPCLPGRAPAAHTMTQTASDYTGNHAHPLPGGMQYADDRLELACHGTTHMDALGHAFAEHTMWGGREARSDQRGVHDADIAALAAKGVVGRAVLVDVARHRGLEHLPMGSRITIREIEDVLDAQHVELRSGDTLILRTGIFNMFYQKGPEHYYANFSEPGVTYEPATIDFFQRHDIAGLGSDTLCNEQAHNAEHDAMFPLHVLLQRNLGVIFHEVLWLEEWAEYCAEVDRYEAFYIAAPLNLVGGSGAPMNPVAIM